MRHIHCKLLLAFAFLLFTLPAFGAETRGVKRVEIKTSSGETVGLYEESHALVIGVSDYTNGWPKLPGVRKDVKAVTAALETHGFNVEVVEDAKDYDALDDAFTGFIRRHGRKPENRLLFYFAGHGHTVKNYGEEMGYIIPTSSPNPNRDLDGFLDSAMDMRQIEVYAQRIRSKHALFLFDSCFSGSLFALSRAVPENISYKTTKPVRQFITSGSAEEQVPDTSIFRQQFVAALSGEGDTDGDRYVTAIELGEFLQKTVVNYSRNAQHPQYGKIRNPNLDKGDFVFALPKVVTEPEPSSIAAAPASATPSTSVPSEFRADEEAWKTLMDSDDPEDFRFFLEEFPESPLAKTAKFKLRQLDRKQAKAKAERQQLAEAKRKAAEEQKQQLAEEAKQEEERKRVEAEQRRLAEAKRKAEAERKRQEELAALKQKQESAGEWTESNTGMKFGRIPGGSFRMGSPTTEEGRKDNERQHTVRVGEFWLSTTEVTNRQYRLFKPGHDSKSYKWHSLNGDERPVVYVSRHDAVAYAQWLSRKTGRRFRLPTEAEWEYAARAGTRTARYWGDDPDGACGSANVADKTAKREWASWTVHNCDDGYKVTAPVGRFRANAFGLYDMLGNVWEWTCSEFLGYDKNGHKKCLSNNRAKNNNIRGSLRGGSWYNKPRRVRAANRFPNNPDSRDNIIGFRLARD